MDGEIDPYLATMFVFFLVLSHNRYQFQSQLFPKFLVQPTTKVIFLPISIKINNTFIGIVIVQ